MCAVEAMKSTYLVEDSPSDHGERRHDNEQEERDLRGDVERIFLDREQDRGREQQHERDVFLQIAQVVGERPREQLHQEEDQAEVRQSQRATRWIQHLSRAQELQIACTTDSENRPAIHRR